MAESAGKAVSPVELKATVGRSTLRPGKYHQGGRSDPTAFEALKRAAAGQQQQPLTPLEMKDLLESNPSRVRVLRAAGFSFEQIYEMLNT